MSFESILATVTDEAERTAFAAVAAKYPKVKEYVEYGEMVEPVAAEIKGMNLKFPDEVKELPAWLNYRTQNFDHARGMYRNQAAAIDEAEALKVEKAALAAELEEWKLKGTDMTPEEFKALMAQELDQRGVMTKDALKAEISTPGGVVNSAFMAQSRRFEGVYAALTPRSVEHAAKFKEPMPVAQVFEYMNTKGITDPVAAYDALMAPKLREIELAEHKAAVEAARAEGKNEGMREARMSPGQPGMPVSGGGGMRSMVPSFMKNIMDKRAARANQGTSGRLGDGTAAHEGFAKYQEKQANAGAV